MTPEERKAAVDEAVRRWREWDDAQRGAYLSRVTGAQPFRLPNDGYTDARPWLEDMLGVSSEPRCAQSLVTRLALVASLLVLGLAVWVVVR